MKIVVPIVFLLILVAAIGFSAVAIDGRLDSVVPVGDETRGAQVFATYNCGNCHTLKGMPEPIQALQTVKIQLGGNRKFRSARDIIARSIMSPNHAINEDWERIAKAAGSQGPTVSPMLRAGYSEQMTMQEMIDLATYLDKF